MKFKNAAWRYRMVSAQVNLKDVLFRPLWIGFDAPVRPKLCL